MKHHSWPDLDYQQWKNTYETLHRWCQIVGKLKLNKYPCTNHSWHSALYITPRGISTMAVPDGNRNFSIEFDFIDNKLIFLSSDQRQAEFELKNESVASFYRRFLNALNKLDIKAHLDPHPNELADNIPFDQDTIHRTYVPKHALHAWQIMVRVSNVMTIFRSNFIGKSSPVHFFWGSFDLALTRFSGRTAPEHPGGVPHLPDVVVKEAYSNEVSSCGFWPGNELYPHAAFYSYAYPEPEGFNRASLLSSLLPAGAFYHDTLKEYILPYSEVLKSENPEKLILNFFESTYRAACDFGKWDKDSLEKSFYLSQMRDKSTSFPANDHVNG